MWEILFPRTSILKNLPAGYAPEPPCPYLSYPPPLNPFGPYLEHLPSLKYCIRPRSPAY